MSKNSKAVNFIRKNAYYFVFIACLAVLTVITVALVIAANNPSEPVGNDKVIEKPEEPDNPENPGTQEEPDKPDKPEEPVASVIVFDMPVKNAAVIKEYTDSVVYNKTLGLYTGHKAIDFGAEAGTEVTSVYDGVIESVTTGKIEGTTVVIDHGKGLKSVYNCIDADETLKEGQTVKKGEVIGVVSLNNKTEYKDGAHLHFEVTENGTKVDPEKYLLTEEK